MRSPHRIVVPTLVGLALTACATSRTSVGEKEGAPTGPTGLARSFTVHETRRGSETSNTLSDERVDYDSEIAVKPDATKLGELVGSRGSGSASEIPAKPATSLEALLEPTLGAFETYASRAATYSAGISSSVSVLADDPNWRSLASAQLDIVNNLIEVSSAIAAYEFGIDDPQWYTKDPSELGISDEEYERLAARRTQLDLLFKPNRSNPRLLPDPAGFDVAAVVREVNAVLADQADRLNELAKSTLAGFELQITAELLRGTEAYPVSVAPYSIVEGQSRGAKSRRVSLPSGADMERLDKEYAANDRLAKSIERTRELVDDPEKLTAALKELGEALDKYLKAAEVRLEAKLREAAQSTVPELAEVAQAAKKVLTLLEQLAEAVKALAADAPTLTPPKVLNTAGAVENLIGVDLKQALEELRTRLSSVTVPSPPTFVAELGGIAQAEVGEIEEALANTAFGASLGGLIGSLRQMRTLARADGFGDLKTGKVTRTAYAIDQAPDGVIQLANSPAEADDVLRITYELMPKATPGVEATSPWRESTLLDIRKFGFYTTYNSQVLFADRIGDGSSRFQAAAGLSVNMHYRPESSRAFFDAVAPGIGICVAAPSFENGVELAVGLQATIFNDTIQAGYLYDISVEDNPWAFYFGLDLIQAFRRLQ